jgi:hypothetical protein
MWIPPQAVSSSRRRALPVEKPIFTVAMMLFGILIIVAFIMDGKKLMSQPPPIASPAGAQAMLIEVTTTTNRFADERRAFSVAMPDAWYITTGRDAYPFDMVFRGPNLMSLGIQVTDVRYETIDDLVGRMRSMEKEQGVNTHIEIVTYRGHSAVRRQARLPRIVLRSLDVLAGGKEYHLQFKVPSDIYDLYQPAVDAMLDTFAPAI